MLFIFNKNKIISYFVATSVVAVLFLFSVSIIPNDDVKMIQVSSNISENNIENKIENNINQIEHTYNKQKSKWNNRNYEQKHSNKNNINEGKIEKII